jgi:hydroxymethylglutaryl-CoA reductase
MAEFGSRNGLLPGDPTVMGDPILADDPRLRGFSKLNQEGLYGRLAELRVLRLDDIANLTEGRMLSPEDAAGMIENHIGEFSVPFGVAIGVPVDDRLYTGVPMVNEETSVIATVGNMAREVREKGHLATEVLGNEMIGQIQFDYVDDFAAFEEAVMLNRDALINEVNRNVLASMVERQGGMTDIEVVELPCPDGTTMAAMHIIIDMCDANGANRINQACEYLKGPLEALTGKRAGICILSNLADRRLVSSEIAIPGFDPEHGRAIARASMLANVSPHRAATHNKGIMNGVDAVLIATGNDYRAIEAGAHAYAARSGRYRRFWKLFNCL